MLSPQYKLFFDKEGDFHIETYLFEEGDLEKSLSAFFAPWVYLEGKGFYQLEKPYFDVADKSIPKAEMSEFVNRHRLWLQSFEGFQTHVSGIESHLSYHVNEEGSLYFESRIEESEEIGELIDLGEWIYIKEKGFYAKKSARTGSLLKPGVVIPQERVSAFIDAHKEELEQVKGFFSDKRFLEKVGLSILLDEEERIIVRPEYHFYPPYTSETVQVFDHYMFVKGKGFSEVSSSLVLPKEYTQEKVISPYEEAYFVAYELEQLTPFIISLDPKLKKPTEISLVAKEVTKEERAEGRGWLANLYYETAAGGVEVSKIWEAYTAKRPYLFTEAGLIFLGAQRFTWLKNVSKKRWVKNGKELRLSAMEWLRLFAFEEVKEPLGKDPKEVRTRKLLEELRSFQTEEVIDLKGLKSHLRPYQELGLRWLWFIYTESLSGLLCDEMGLGKTHQAMALLAAASNASSEKSIKYLVVCPTSVIYHWEDLLKQFLPHLRVYVFYGALRNLVAFEEGYDLLLTSYGTLRSEKKALSKIHFEIAIFDELQIAKNAYSQIHKALASIDAHVRIGLTGTPIENQILELKALFDLIIPDYFPSEAAFKEIFVNPIEKYNDKEKKELLSRLIKPFMLRRKKRDVLKELPEKIEEISSCPMSDEQKALYAKIYQTHREAITQEIAGDAPTLSITHIFSLISKLKQLCDHPALLYKTPLDYKQHSSGKWDLFVELLEETRQSGQKCVVFSQYLEMLDIIELHLKENHIRFAGIRGSTQNRKAQLEMFKNDPQCEVFVASLQAAGVGIDLTSASVVIHYDRWWNPAKENQATDRVHRIGQNRGVQVFKLVTKGSIEEHIHTLIEKKIHLMESVVGFDEHDQLKSLNRKELVELLQLLQKDIEL